MSLPALLSQSLVLLQMMCVVVVAAYLLTRCPSFSRTLEGGMLVSDRIILILVFGALSVYGTMSGIEIMGAVINIRDLGPMVAGLLGGPYVGLGAGIIGAVYRLSLAGFTVYACSVATVLAGVLGGVIYLANRKQFPGIWISVAFAAGMECIHMVLVPIMCTPLSAAMEVVSQVAIPMILANSAGMFIFAFIISNLRTERKTALERDGLLREIERKNTELRIAADIQQSFLPDTIAPVRGFDISAKSIPAREVGGDFFDVIPFAVLRMKRNRVGILIADVAGKGIPAALFMALSRIVIRVNALWHPEAHLAIQDANGIITADSKSGMFVTLFYGVIDEDERTLTYVNAGHNPPLVLRSGGREIAELESTGIALGAVEDAVYTEETISVTAGDIVVLYTDGVTEAMNGMEEMFGEGRLHEILIENRDLPAGALLDKILSRVQEFAGNHPQSDDITLMVIRGV